MPPKLELNSFEPPSDFDKVPQKLQMPIPKVIRMMAFCWGVIATKDVIGEYWRNLERDATGGEIVMEYVAGDNKALNKTVKECKWIMMCGGRSWRKRRQSK